MLIFLIGFMGSGKSHWGKRWSAQNGYQFIDMDAAIESEQHQSISDIFQQFGEAKFRELESAKLRSFNPSNNLLISCGGGTPCFNNNMEWMNANGLTIYLQVTPQVLASRLVKEKAQRPLIKNIPDEELASFIEGKLKDREPYYCQAKMILDESTANVDTFVQKILPHIHE